MRFKSERVRLSGLSVTGDTPNARPGPLAQVLSYLATALALVLALAFSAVVFGLLLCIGLLVGIWFWWKTRSLRRQMQEAADAATSNRPAPDHATGHRHAEGEIIEGVGVRIEEETSRLTDAER